MRSITLNVPQGLGDLFWVYQLFAPIVERVNFTIHAISSSGSQFRSAEWPHLWPKVGAVNFRLVTSQRYQQITQSRRTVAECLAEAAAGQSDGVDFAANAWLEDGRRLEDLDPLHPPQWDVPIRSAPAAGLPERYLLLCVSGDTQRHPRGCWSIEQWLELIDRLYLRDSRSLPIVQLGAEFDRAVIELLDRELRARGHRTQAVIQPPPAEAADVLRRCELLLGYQSGLNVLADQFDRPQLMLYFRGLAQMHYTWCKPANCRRLFFAASFSETPAEALEQFDKGNP